MGDGDVGDEAVGHVKHFLLLPDSREYRCYRPYLKTRHESGRKRDKIRVAAWVDSPTTAHVPNTSPRWCVGMVPVPVGNVHVVEVIRCAVETDLDGEFVGRLDASVGVNGEKRRKDV